MLTGTLSPTSRSCTMRLLVNARRAETTATRERIAASMECAAAGDSSLSVFRNRF